VIATAERSIMSIGCQDANSQTQFQGTAFMVAGPSAPVAQQTSNGKAITASHVVSACGAGSVITAFGPVDASLLESDVTHDVAVLSISGELEVPLPIESAPPHVGEQVALLGEAHQQPEVTQGTITGVGVPQTLAGGAATETLTDSIRVQTSSIAGESGGPAIDAGGKVVGIIEGGNQTGSSTVLTPISDMPAGTTAAPPQPEPTTTETAPSTTPPPTATSAQPASVTCGGFLLGPDPMDVISNIQATGVSCGLAENVVNGARDPGASFDVFTNYQSNGFECHGTFVGRPGGGEGHIHFVCTNAGSSIAFDHG
jgi:hypothetical protein